MPCVHARFQRACLLPFRHVPESPVRGCPRSRSRPRPQRGPGRAARPTCCCRPRRRRRRRPRRFGPRRGGHWKCTGPCDCMDVFRPWRLSALPIAIAPAMHTQTCFVECVHTPMHTHLSSRRLAESLPPTMPFSARSGVLTGEEFHFPLVPPRVATGCGGCFFRCGDSCWPDPALSLRLRKRRASPVSGAVSGAGSSGSGSGCHVSRRGRNEMSN